MRPIESEIPHLILESVQRRGMASFNDVAEDVHISLREVRTVLSSMKEDGRVRVFRRSLRSGSYVYLWSVVEEKSE